MTLKYVPSISQGDEIIVENYPYVLVNTTVSIPKIEILKSVTNRSLLFGDSGGYQIYNLNKRYEEGKGKRQCLVIPGWGKEIEILIIDPFIDFHRRDENNNTDMNKVMKSLDSISHQTDVAIILIHHVSKSADRSGKISIRGATAIPNSSDTVMEYSKGRNSDERKIKISKINNGPAREVIHLKLNQYLLLEVVQDQSKCTVDDVAKVLKKKFNGDCKKKGDLVNRLCKNKKCSEKTASKAIKKAIKKGVIEESLDGKRKRIKLK